MRERHEPRGTNEPQKSLFSFPLHSRRGHYGVNRRKTLRLHRFRLWPGVRPRFTCFIAFLSFSHSSTTTSCYFAAAVAAVVLILLPLLLLAAAACW